MSGMATFTRSHHSGTGPGDFTPDGCSVEMYARLPETGETEIIAPALPTAAGLLELGAGAGRMTRPLLERGFRVTAVDESPQMLERIAGARTVCAPIEDLDLGERFDAVLLASLLVNTADPAQCARLLRTCARHVADDGAVIIQREPDDRHESRRAGDTVTHAGMTITVLAIDPVADGVSRTRVAYEFEGTRWTQTYYSRRLLRPAFEAALREAGLAVDAYLTEDGTWVRAVPVPVPSC